MISSKNIVFPIKNVDDTPFHDLVLHKATFDSVVMSLSDKITGDVYYKDTSLKCSMNEYIVYDGVKYSLVNPPTIVREGMVSDNSDLNGMTKYSFEFYHPMYMLNNIPFTDVAVSSDELQYKSQDKNFAWAGYIADFIAKLNKNLQNTQWVCDLNVDDQDDVLKKFSDVLTFSDNTIADALKTAYDTWEISFVIDILSVTDSRYSDGKRFLIHFGEPSNEIYESEEDKANDKPFVFKFGQGVGLKNNSATPKNNKIVTRIAGYGSERNVPFGYPQIVWDVNDDEKDLQYPLYDGIVGGKWVKLIKHPFTRNHLMPSIYEETVRRKVNPRVDYYDPDTEIIDYYDAIGTEYPHNYNPQAPSYEIHEFEDVFPELGTEHIIDAHPIDDSTQEIVESWDDTMDDDGNYLQGYFKLTLPKLDFDLYACASITEEMQINMRSGACIGCTFDIQVDWEDYKKNFYDDDGNFDPDGAKRDLSKYPKSNSGEITVICQKDINTFGTIMPNVYQHPKGKSETYDGDEFVILGISLPQSYIWNAQKRLDEAMKTYMLENNVYYFEYPLKFDEHFLVTHPYVLSQIKNNAIIRFEFNGKEIPLYVKQITIKYGDTPLPQYAITLTDEIEVVSNQFTKVNDAVGRIGVQITALQSALKNAGGGAGTDVTKLSKVVDDIASGKITFLKGFDAGNFIVDSSGAGLFENNDGWTFETDYLHVRKKLQADTVEILHSSHIGGRLIATPASMVISKVEYIDDHTINYFGGEWNGSCYKCYFNTKDDDGNKIYNTFTQGDLAYCETYNLEYSPIGITHTEQGANHFFWRKVVEAGNDYIILSNVLGEYAAESDYPLVGDHVTLLGSQALLQNPISGIGGSTTPVYGTEFDKSRQNAIIIAGAGSGNPFIRVYRGIDSFVLPTPDVQISPYGSWITVTDSNGNDVKIDELIDSLKDQVEQVKEQDDKQIVLWFGNEEPKLENDPAKDWTTEQIRHEHTNDIYYNRDAGKAYSFVEDIEDGVASYYWDLLTDTDVIRSLELAAAAQDTADGKRRVFVARPRQEDIYDVGDLWVNATFPTELSDGEDTFGDSSGQLHTIDNPLYNNDILRCVVAKESGEHFMISHWQPVQHYTTSKILQEADRISLEITSGLKKTGIDITSNPSKITLTADNTEISDNLTVKQLETKPDTSEDETNKARIVAKGSIMEVYGASGVMNIQFGVDTETGYAVLKYFNNGGELLYDLGPNGLNFFNVNEEKFTGKSIIFVSTDLDYDGYKTDTKTETTTIFMYSAKRISGKVFGGDASGNNDAIALKADGLWFTSNDTVATGNALDASKLANGLYRYSDSEVEIIDGTKEFAETPTIDEFKNELINVYGFNANDVESLDYTFEKTELGLDKLVRPIYYRQYAPFINGIENSSIIRAWQN